MSGQAFSISKSENELTSFAWKLQTEALNYHSFLNISNIYAYL